MQRFKVIIVEDSPDEADVLEGHLERFARENGLAFSITLDTSALEFMSGPLDADLVFMDIDLPGISGMEAAEFLRGRDAATPLIFVTNLAQYAVRGYQVDALDFMVKPVSYPDFALRMGRALRVMRRNTEQVVTVPAIGGMTRVPLADIIYIETQGHDLLIHRASDMAGSNGAGQEGAGAVKASPLRTRSSIRHAREMLPEELFLQISQSCLANMQHIASVRGDELEMDDGARLYFSRSRKKACLEALSRYLGGTA